MDLEAACDATEQEQYVRCEQRPVALIANKRKPFLLVESKLSDTEASPALKKFQRALNIPAVQLVEESGGYRILSNERQSILVVPAYQWLSHLP